MIAATEVLAASILFVWVLVVVGLITRRIYQALRSRGVSHLVAVYYNRKIIHISTGGLCGIAIPFAFSTPILPSILAMLLAVLTYLPHRVGRLMYWFQTEDNCYEVSFCVMWGLTVAAGWILSGGDFWLGVLPILFMSIGDAVTGIVRNLVYGRRTKSWLGNFAMALFSVPVGAILGLAGVLAGLIASLIEHFEFGRIDDNVTVPLVSFSVLLLAYLYAPWTLTF